MTQLTMYYRKIFQIYEQLLFKSLYQIHSTAGWLKKVLLKRLAYLILIRRLSSCS